jgi:spoIIIJ-associated protein
MSERFEGRNLEDALTHASETLGVDRWQLTYHVLLEKRGFLGGVKRIVIEADVNREAPPPPVAAPPPPIERDGNRLVEPREARAPRAERGPRGPRRERAGGGGRGREGGSSAPREGGGGGSRGGGRRGGRGGGQGRGDQDFRSGDFETFLGTIPDQGPESDAARLVREWVEDTVVLAKLDLVARTEETEENILVRLYGADSRRLTDRHGELLDAIQVLANKALVGRKVEKEIELDSEEFKDKRNTDLQQRAQEVADRVRRGGREELLPAMSPIERRIVHMALREDTDVTTESRGEGFFKRVAIIVRPAAEASSEPVADDEAAPQPAPES